MARIHLLDGEWLIATDPENVGRDLKYFTSPISSALRAHVPGVIEETFPSYDGIVWYWRVFSLPEADWGCPWSALRFWAADYYAEVWLNGRFVGAHEGGETPFTLDIRGVLNPVGENLLSVRLINPGDQVIDNFDFAHIPHGVKSLPFRPGGIQNWGGIWQSVEVVARPEVHVADVFVEPHIWREEALVHTTVVNETSGTITGLLIMTVTKSGDDRPTLRERHRVRVPHGRHVIDTTFRIHQAQFWSLDEPNLYRLDLCFEGRGQEVDQFSTRFGFREFTFKDGHFFLNGKRILLKGTHTVGHYPIGVALPRGPEQLRRELLTLREMGLNCCRSLGRMMFPMQLDFCDELGLMVYQETLASCRWEPSAAASRRFDTHVCEMILRDRNHPCVIIWGLLNESRHTEIFQHAVQLLPTIRRLDPTRLVLLNSGRYDEPGPMKEGIEPQVGSFAPPYDAEWRHGLIDVHRYVTRPLDDDAIRWFRTVGCSGHSVFLSEHGHGSAIDPIRVCRLFEQSHGRAELDDYRHYLRIAENLGVDFERFGLDTVFPTPSDLVRASEHLHADNRAFAIAVLRSNRNIRGYSITGMVDHTMVGEGLMTFFREPKSGVIDALRDAWQPFCWSVLLDRTSLYRSQTVRVEATLSMEHAPRAGRYLAYLVVTGPGGKLLELSANVCIPPSSRQEQPEMVLPVFDEQVAVDGPPGSYEVRVGFKGGLAAVGRAHFYVSEPPRKEAGIVAVWDSNRDLADWLSNHGLDVKFIEGFEVQGDDVALNHRRIIVNRPILTGEGALTPLLKWIMNGGTAVFLSPTLFGLREDEIRDANIYYLGQITDCPFGAAVKQARGLWWAIDHVVKEHPLVNGLPTRQLMDLHYYRLVYPRWSYIGVPDGDVAIAAVGIGTCGEDFNYWMGADLVAIPWGNGRAILSTLLIAENIGLDPAADRLLLNLATAG